MASGERWPQVIDVLAAFTQGNYLIPPRTPIYALVWNTVTDIGLRFRFTPSQPWVTARAGDSYTFMPPLQDGIEIDVATTGANPAAVAIYATSPCQLTFAGS